MEIKYDNIEWLTLAAVVIVLPSDVTSQPILNSWFIVSSSCQKSVLLPIN